jgi:hypothetical protein
MGIYGGNVYDPENASADGKPCSVVQASAIRAADRTPMAVAAIQQHEMPATPAR